MLARSFLIESSSKMEKCCLHASSFIFDRIIIKFAGNQDRHKSSVELVLGRIRPLIMELLALEWRKIHTFELEYPWSQSVNFDQILYVASMGWGKGCLRFWGRLDRNSGFHGNRKPPLTYNGENDVSAFSRLFLILSFLYLQVTRTSIKSRMSSNFGQIGQLTTELAALEVSNISHRLIMVKWCLRASSFNFDRIIIKVAGNQDRH